MIPTPNAYESFRAKQGGSSGKLDRLFWVSLCRSRELAGAVPSALPRCRPKTTDKIAVFASYCRVEGDPVAGPVAVELVDNGVNTGLCPEGPQATHLVTAAP